jgi:hypothetical protein
MTSLLRHCSSSPLTSATRRGLGYFAALPSASAPSSASLSFHEDISYKDLKTIIGNNQRKVPANKDLVFGRTFAEHMLSIEWEAGKGFLAPRIHPYQKISLEPSATVFHYGVECFEVKNFFSVLCNLLNRCYYYRV